VNDLILYSTHDINAVVLLAGTYKVNVGSGLCLTHQWTLELRLYEHLGMV